MNRKRVLFIVLGFEIGGIETYIKRFLEFQDEKLEITVLSKSGVGGYYKKVYESLGAKTISLKVGYFNIFEWFELFLFLKKNGFAVICDFTGSFSGVPLYIAKLAGVNKRIAFYRSSRYAFEPSFFRYVYVRILEILLKYSATKILSNSYSALDFFHRERNKDNKKFKVIYNGIPVPNKINIPPQKLREQLGIPKDAYVIGHVGRYANQKNHKTICEVGKILLKENPSIYFLLCGKNVGENISDFLKKNDIADNFITPGVCNNIFDYYNIMDLFLFPSKFEGHPNALFEAMISEVPIVGSNVSSIIEAIPKEMIANFFPPLDATSMANRIIEIKNKGINYNVQEYADWLKEAFSPEKKFLEFLDELNR